MYSNGVRVAKCGIFLKHKQAGLMVGKYVVFTIQLCVYFVYFTLCIHNATYLGVFVCVHICICKAILSLCVFCVCYMTVFDVQTTHLSSSSATHATYTHLLTIQVYI